MRDGRRWSLFVWARPRTLAEPAVIAACFLKRCRGLRAPAVHGGIYRLCLANRTRCSSAIAIGERRCFQTAFDAVPDDPDRQFAMAGATSQGPSPRTGRKGATQNQAMGKSKGGWTTKILAAADALGTLARFVPPPGPP